MPILICALIEPVLAHHIVVVVKDVHSIRNVARIAVAVSKRIGDLVDHVIDPRIPMVILIAGITGVRATIVGVGQPAVIPATT